ncbi:bifunctional adenosylcobinamide kinase/adenosylcobinamide-phosphate guanylyltransferase [bacterium]|nr:bifunctional adenosylcobinamide kinase/adenosylcobinamide-phosphate guanylyltransferase [bacterium]
MGKTEIILLTGGARSGKSTMALKLAAEHTPKIFLATAEALDQEMSDRIRQHRLERTEDWITIEEPVFVEPILQKHREGAVVLDCITLWLSNLLIRKFTELQIQTEVQHLADALQRRSTTSIVVTNEVGMGIVPEYPSGRLFRDLAGSTNQIIANIADRVIFMVSGIPVFVK